MISLNGFFFLSLWVMIGEHGLFHRWDLVPRGEGIVLDLVWIRKERIR